MEPQGKVICFSGSIGSGKTTISSILASALGWKWVSFGEYVRKIARELSIGYSRRELQYVSDVLIKQGWEIFCRSVLKEVQWNESENLIVDGVRHYEAITTLRDICHPAKVFLIYLSISKAEQYKRVKSKGITSHSELLEIEAHPSESQVSSELRKIADMVFDGSQPKNKVVKEIEEWMTAKVI